MRFGCKGRRRCQWGQEHYLDPAVDPTERPPGIADLLSHLSPYCLWESGIVQQGIPKLQQRLMSWNTAVRQGLLAHPSVHDPTGRKSSPRWQGSMIKVL